ncbi:MAG TPA: hypothetical protein VLH60_03135 [Sedimentisphaerales bacterium]|nr:hypothetical protein [Sedimentisphaerales bacterium]
MDKKRIRRVLYWFAAELLIIAIILWLLVYRPRGYEAVVPDASGRISPYLTHGIAQEFYNKAQLGDPFELVIEDSALNEIIATGTWIIPQTEAQASLPVVRFLPGRAVVMASAWLSGMEFVATIKLSAPSHDDGRIGLSLDSVRVGAVPVTIAARAVAKRMYNEQIADLPPDHISAQVGAAIFDNQPFEPIFDVGGRRVKINKIELRDGNVRIGFIPVKMR